MDSFGINTYLLAIQITSIAVVIGLPILSLIDLKKKGLPSLPLVLWALVICMLPLLGPLAYWIIKPVPEKNK